MATDANFNFKGGDTTVLAVLCLWDWLGILGSFRRETSTLMMLPYRRVCLPEYSSLTAEDHCIKPLSVGGSNFKKGKKTAYSPKSDFIAIWHFVW